MLGVMLSVIVAARGMERLTAIAALPVVDAGAGVGYVGSIDPSGGNDDCRWGEVQDDHGEWILFEHEGPGCIFNFVQHRYTKAEEPVFRFYFDGEEVPRFKVRPSEFGTKPPFLRPLADIHMTPSTPEDKVRRGQIRIVRSHVPMEFERSCRVTSSVRLREPEGGWGHLVYHAYETPKGLKTFDSARDVAQLAARFEGPLGLPAKREQAFADRLVVEGRDTLTSLAFDLDASDLSVFTNLFVRLSFDGRETCVAPIGTFFGCEMPIRGAKVRLALLTLEIGADGRAHLENRFPMPFFRRMELRLEWRGGRSVSVAGRAGFDPSLAYDPSCTGYFTATEYRPKTRNVVGENQRIGRFTGRGQMVYGVISGHDYKAVGCEGDVRCFIDDTTVPRVQSDGSESWGCWGNGFWGNSFVQPFSAYCSPVPWSVTWSECRLAYPEAYCFRRFLRFDLEHGCRNDRPEASASGQCFGYVIGDLTNEEKQL